MILDSLGQMLEHIGKPTSSVTVLNLGLLGLSKSEWSLRIAISLGMTSAGI
jgi:hypothetical protein